jgi:hypothetical protein
VANGPPRWVPDLLGRVRTAHRRIPGFWGKEYPNPAQEGVQGRHVSRPSLVRTCPHNMTRRRSGAAKRPTVRDVSLQDGPDVRPLCHDCPCIYCGQDAPPDYPADRRCAPSAFNAPCPLNWQAAPKPSCRRRVRLFPLANSKPMSWHAPHPS